LEGKDLRSQPLNARRKALANVLKDASDIIRLSDELRGSRDDLIRVAQEFDPRGAGRQKTEFGL
jgi:hypothetical protein